MAVAVGEPSLARRAAVASAIAVTIGAAGAAVAIFRKPLLLVLLGLIFNELFQAIAEPLAKRFGGPRVLWVSVAVVLVLAAIACVVALFVYPFAEQLSNLANDLPGLARKVVERGERLAHSLDAARGGRGPARPPLELDKVVAGRIADVTVGAGAFVLTAAEAVFQALAVVFLGVFVAASPLAHRIAFLSLLPEPLRPRGRQFLATARKALRDWMVAVTFSMAIMGALVTAGLWLIGVPYFLVFGALAGAMELVPYLGPAMAFTAPFLLCVATDPSKAVSVGIFYLIGHGLEANVIVLLVVKSRAHLPPSLVVLAILFLGGIAGVVGLIAATPVLAMTLAAVRELWLEPRTTGAVQVEPATPARTAA